MRTWKLATLGTMLAGGGTLAACGGAADGSEPSGGMVTGARSAAILNGYDDVDTPERNVVVRIGIFDAEGYPGATCTGTLITPSLLLTANHCVLGAVGCSNPSDPPHAVVVGQAIRVGPVSASPHALQPDFATPWLEESRIVQYRSMPGGPTVCPGTGTNDDVDTDLALVDIYPPVVNAKLSGAAVAYPRFPRLTPIVPYATQTIRIAGWGLTTSGDLATVRQVNGPFALTGFLDADGNGDIRLTLRNDGRPGGTDGGDSGGPLWLLREDGEYDQVGVCFGGSGNVDYWTNLTRDDNNLWLANNAADPEKPGRYRGQSDYVGPCDPGRDADCDHIDDAPVCAIVDGKRTCKVNDNCPGHYNPAQFPSPDADGDGFPDGLLSDGDNDGVPDYCDDEPQCSYLLSVEGKDYDGDGLCGVYDELCPFDDANDGDGDGVCDGVDNCLDVTNPSQANCNLEAEEATKSVVLGDACDPVPCPGFRVSKAATTECQDGSCGTVTRIPDSAVRPNISVDTVGSSNVVTGGNEQVVQATTEHRYCIEGAYPLAGGERGSTECFADGAVDDAFLTTPLLLENQFSRFHRVRVGTIPNAQSSTAAISYGSASPLAAYRWRHTLDFADWRSSVWGADWVKDPYTQPLGVRSLQSGRYWLHANTPVGQTVALAGNGLHTKLDGTQGESLANHYEQAYPVTVTPHLNDDLTCVGVRCIVPFEPCIGQNCLAEVPCIGSTCEGPCITCELGQLAELDPNEVRVLGVVATGGVGRLTRTGGLSRLDDRTLSPGAIALLTAADRTVLRAVEPSRSVGRGFGSPQALVLDASTYGVVERLDVRGPSLFAGRELRGATEGGQRAAAPAPAVAIGAPPPRQGAATVYSAAIGRAFVIGGRSAVGQELRDVWSTSIDDQSGEWSRLAVKGATLGSVVAATYAYADGNLWVLDEVRGVLGLKMRRLLQIDAKTGQANVVGAWPRLGIYDKHWLGIDKDGSVLLTASSSRLQGGHTIVRLATAGPAKVTGVFSGPRALAMAPIVDRSGYTLIGPKRAVGAAADVRRLDELGMGAGAWSHLAGCL